MSIASLLAQQPAPASTDAFAPTDQLPFDPAVTTGTLPNGLHVLHPAQHRRRSACILQLAVKAGSVDEEDDQQGLAHFLEHMAFNGTTHFKPGELIATLESTGARLGPHVNAYTVVRRNGLHVPAADRQARASSKRACRRWRISPAA